MRRIWLIVLVVGALVVPALAIAAGGPQLDRDESRGNPGGGAAKAGTLSESQEQALIDYYLTGAQALHSYRAVMMQFGEVNPFVSIAGSEEKHIEVLQKVFHRYGLALPDVSSIASPEFTSITDACEFAAQIAAESANQYAKASDIFHQSDILRIAHKLSRVSSDKHLLKFENCADGSTASGVSGSSSQMTDLDSEFLGSGELFRSGRQGRGNRWGMGTEHQVLTAAVSSRGK